MGREISELHAGFRSTTDSVERSHADLERDLMMMTKMLERVSQERGESDQLKSGLLRAHARAPLVRWDHSGIGYVLPPFGNRVVQ